MTRDQLLAGAKALPKDQRIELVMELWDAISDDEFPLTNAQREDLDRRIAEDDADASPGDEWEVFQAKLLRKEF